MKVLWLRYFTEIDGYMETVPQDLLDSSEINKAMEVVEESSYTPEQLLGYDMFWDIIRTEKTYYYSAEKKGLEKGLAEGRAEGEQIKTLEIARKMKAMGLSLADIKNATGLADESIEKL